MEMKCECCSNEHTNELRLLDGMITYYLCDNCFKSLQMCEEYFKGCKDEIFEQEKH